MSEKRFTVKTVPLPEVHFKPSTDRLVKELHKPPRRNWPRRVVQVGGVDDVWAMDLIIMATTSREEGSKRQQERGRKAAVDAKGETYLNILTIVDVLSKYLWAVPLKGKTAAETSRAIQKVIEESGRKPNKVWVDEGGEFMKNNGASLSKKFVTYSTYTPMKSMVCERAIKTLKGWMWREFTRRKELGLKPVYNWLEDLPKQVERYNNTKHNGLKYQLMNGKKARFTPNEALKPENSEKVMEMVNDKANSVPEPKYPLKLGDFVRIVKAKGMLAKEKKFRKGFEVGWSREVYRVVEVINSKPKMYRLMNAEGETDDGVGLVDNVKKAKGEKKKTRVLDRSYYTEELQKTAFVPALGDFAGTGL